MPSINTIHIDAALTDVSTRRPYEGRYIANRIFPVKTVKKQTDLVYEIDTTNESQRVSDTLAGIGAPGLEVDYKVEADIVYNCKKRKLAHFVPDEIVDNADVAIEPLINGTIFLREKFMTEMETNFVAALTAGYTGAKTASPSNKWDNYTSGEPLADLRLRINAMVEASGQPRAKIGVGMDARVLDVIANHPEVVDRFKHTMGPDQVNSIDIYATILRNVLAIGQVEIADAATKNTGRYLGTPTNSNIWGDNVFIYAIDTPRLNTNASGLTFQWSGPTIGTPLEGAPFIVKRFRIEERDGELIQMSTYYDQKIISGAGFLFTNVCAGF